MRLTRTNRLVLPALIAAIVAAVAGCGGGGNTGSGDNAGGGATTAVPTRTATETIPPTVIRQANANCRQLKREARDAALGVITTSNSAFEALNLIVRRSIPILERFAERQRALSDEADSALYDAYLRPIDPISVLLRKRLRAGEAGDIEQSRRLNGLIAGLSVEQQNAARDAGLTGCDVDFRDVVTNAAVGG